MVTDDIAKTAKVANALKILTYKNYSDRQREDFINRMIESAQQRVLATKFAKELGIEPRVAQKW